MKKVSVVITDMQLRTQFGGGQFVVKTLLLGLKKRYKLTYFRQHASQNVGGIS